MAHHTGSGIYPGSLNARSYQVRDARHFLEQAGITP